MAELTECERKVRTKNILCVLNERKMRATYSVVACLLDTGSQSVGDYLGDPRHEASWVVAKSTDASKGRTRGQPTRYKHSDIHPDLCNDPRIIESCWELRKCLRLPSPRKHNRYCDGRKVAEEHT